MKTGTATFARAGSCGGDDGVCRGCGRTGRVTELEPDFSAVKKGGLDRQLFERGEETALLEGSAAFKKDGYYYLMMVSAYLPMRPLMEAVAVRAVDAALHDPRFPPVSERELSSLRVEVSALTPPKRIASWNDIVLGRDGMTLEKNGRFAVFLPPVAPEQGWDLPTTLSYLSQKADLAPDAWRDGATFETFQAEVFHE